MQEANKHILAFDSKWCGDTLLSSSSIQQLSASSAELYKLAKLRLQSALCLMMELIGIFLLLCGVIWSVPLFFIGGVVLKIACYLITGIILNKSGTLLSIWFHKHLELFRQYQKEIGGALNLKGLTEAEIKGLSVLPTELYSTEISSHPYYFYLNLLTPLVCALTLFVHEDYISAFVIAMVGVSAIFLGSYFYKNFSFRQQREQRLALSAHEYNYLETSYADHLALTVKVNFMTQLPLALFTICFILGTSSSIFANYLAFTMGLTCLSGLLAFQKIKIHSKHAVEKAKHYINALASKDFILTNERWEEHIRNTPKTNVVDVIEDGIFIHNLTPTAFGLDNNATGTLSVAIPLGNAFIYQAPSGHGKSLLLLALLQMIEHTGDVYVIQKGIITNIHSLCKESWQKGVIYYRDEDLSQTARIADLFSEIFVMQEPLIHRQMLKNFGKELTNLAWQGDDNLIEMEIWALEQGEKSPFPASMLDELKKMRNERKAFVEQFLSIGFGKLHHIYPERVLCTLSAGEKRRIINLLTLARAQIQKQPYLIIFDEPLAHLDEASVEIQLQCLEFLNQSIATPILIISHHHINELTMKLVSRKLKVS